MDKQELENKLESTKSLIDALDKSITDLDRSVRRILTQRDYAYIKKAEIEKKLKEIGE